jgi:hypothetical protein
VAPIARVEVIVADGPWQKARLVRRSMWHGSQQWEFLASGLRPGEVRIRARASDPADRSSRRNRRGYAANFIHEVAVVLR